MKGLLGCLFLLIASCSADHQLKVSDAEALYSKNCKVCHAQGINGAPILGNSKMWAPRVTQDRDTLYEHAIHGFGLMPANLGRNELNEQSIRQAVDFMLSQLSE
jgi:cytochrome c5